MIKDIILITYTLTAGIIYAIMVERAVKEWIRFLVFLALLLVAYSLLNYWYQVK